MVEPEVAVTEVAVQEEAQAIAPKKMRELKPLEKRFCELHIHEENQTEAYRMAREEVGLPPFKHKLSYRSRAHEMMDRPVVQEYWKQCVQNYALTFPNSKLPSHLRYHVQGKRCIKSPDWLLEKVNSYFADKRNEPFGYDRFCEWLGVSGATMDKYGSGANGEEYIDVVDWIQTRCRAYYEKMGSDNPKYANFTDYMLSRRKSPRVQQVEAKVAGFILEVGRKEEAK